MDPAELINALMQGRSNDPEIKAVLAQIKGQDPELDAAIAELTSPAKADLINGANATGLFAAILNDDVAALRSSIEAGDNLFAVNENNFHPLQLAARLGRTEHLKVILNEKFPVDEPGLSTPPALLMAIEGGHLEAVETLLAAGAECKNNSIPLMMAAIVFGHLDLVDALARAGASVNTMDAEKDCALFQAIKSGEVALVQQLCALGADLELRHQDGFNPLGLAALMGQTAMIELLIKQGVDVHADAFDSGEMSALNVAIHEHEDPSIVKALLEGGANPNRLDAGKNTALLTASATHGNIEIAQLLIDAGVNVSAVDEEGSSAEACAREIGFGEFADLCAANV